MPEKYPVIFNFRPKFGFIRGERRLYTNKYEDTQSNEQNNFNFWAGDLPV